MNIDLSKVFYRELFLYACKVSSLNGGDQQQSLNEPANSDVQPFACIIQKILKEDYILKNYF